MLLIRRVAAAAIGVAIACTATVAIQAPAQGATTLVLAYEHDNFTGATFGVFNLASGYVCTNSFTDLEGFANQLGNMNNRISAYSLLNNCSARFWDNSNFSGNHVDFIKARRGSYSFVGFNDKTSSIDVS